jgi:hypothetical protein
MTIKVGEIADLLRHCELDYKDAFNKAMTEVPQAASYYDNVMQNRHLVAHQTGTNITFAELETAFKESRIVFQAIADALGLTAAETAGF